ncbi:hypothetical protein KR222_009047, partial [Zaprionus bogoriensis]
LAGYIYTNYSPPSFTALLEKVESKHAQDNICGYLRNLQCRLGQTLQQHSQMIHSSVGLIKELVEVAKMLALSQSNSELQANKIKRLIKEFESFNAGDTSPGLNAADVVQLRDLIADYRRLEESQLLQDSLLSFKHARDSLEKVAALLRQLNAAGWEMELDGETEQRSPDTAAQLEGSQSASRSLREKIRAFNKASEQGENALQNFALCFSNNNSSTNIANVSASLPPENSKSLTNSGYEGDVDSEADQ